MSAKKTNGHKEVAIVKAGALLSGAVTVDELAEDAEQGGHGFASTDLAPPFVRILQKLSPQLDKTESTFIKGAEEGDFLNSATGRVYRGDPGIHFVPAAYTINYTEWKPRDSGGGLVADHGTNKDCFKKTTRVKGRDMTNDGNVIVTSGLYFGYVVDPKTGDSEQAILAMSSTQLKKSRNINTLIQNFRMEITTKEGPKRINPRMWFHMFHITTVPESNDQGKWMGYRAKRVGSILEHAWGHDLYEHAKMLADMFAKGEIRVRAEQMKGEADDPGVAGDAASTGDTRPQAPTPVDPDIPF